MSDRRDVLLLTVERSRGQTTRTRIEPRSDDRFELVKERWNGCRWVIQGRELVADVTVEGQPDALA